MIGACEVPGTVIEEETMSIVLKSIRALEGDSYEATIEDSDGVRTFVFSYNEKRKSLRPDTAFMAYRWGRLVGRDVGIALGRFARGEEVELPMELEETSAKLL
jgi:hypothetical protein